MQAFKPAYLLKRDSNAGVFLWTCEIFKSIYSEVHLQTTEILGFTKYFLTCQQTLAPPNSCLLLHYSRTLFSMFCPLIASLNAFSHCKKFVLIHNAQNLRSGFIDTNKHCTAASVIKVSLLKVGLFLILEVHYTLFTDST